MNYITLNNGIIVPQIGIGTFAIGEKNMDLAISTSIDNSYRLFDTSPNYENDVFLGQSIKKLTVERNEISIVGKIDTKEQRHSIRGALEGSLERLGVDYIDMYLIHWPYPKYYIKTWKKLEKLYEEGLIKSIGVCNCNVHHLEPLINKANIIPAVNQIEMHPLFTQMDTVEYCNRKGIKIMAYSPLARMNSELVNCKLLNELANKYEKTVPQIILKWDIQNGFIVIPKSQNPSRIRQNIDIFDFDLSIKEMDQISSLNKDHRVRFDPDDLSRYPKSLYKRVVNKGMKKIMNIVK